MKLLYFLFGLLLSLLLVPLLLQWFINFTREPVQRDDGSKDTDHETGENEKNCWCKPDMVYEFEGRELWVHHGNGEELPPSSIIAGAVLDILMDR